MAKTLKFAYILLFLAIAGCQQERQNNDKSGSERGKRDALLSSIHIVEKKIVGIPCIGDLASWERRYALSNKDANKIEFVFREAGKFGFKSGRYIPPANNLYEIDDRPYRTAYGSFDISGSKLNLEYCGLNAPVAGQGK